MYDTEEEIKRKRRKLLIIIGVIALIILLLIIFLFTRNSGKKKNSNTATEISCQLGIQNDDSADSNGIYHQPVTVEFKSITAISRDYQIVKQSIGTVDRSSNKETFSAVKSGTYHLYGYVQDSAGHRGKCEIKFQVSLSVPTCELEVTKATLGDNNWYRSDVEVGFKAMSANNPSVSIAKYYIEKEVINPETKEVVKQDAPASNMEKYTVKDNMTSTLVGHVIDSTGSEGTCKIEVKKDSTVPTCSLKVNSGTKNNNGEYTDNPEIAIAEAKDEVSQIASQGVGISKNYEQSTFKVTELGKTTVVGYVKDKAGNEGTCSLEITRSNGSTPTPTPKPTGNSNPTCNIELRGTTLRSGVYSQSVTATLKYSTTNGATITKYGIAESQTYNQRKEIVISNAGSHTVYGIVQDSNGNVKTCHSAAFTVEKGELLASKVQVGDFVGYDAGTWNETRGEQKTDGYYWGMKSGTSKQTGVKCNPNDLNTMNGWRVLSVANGKVTLIHAGTPECVYHDRTSGNNVINVMISESQKYVNSKWSDGYTALSCSTAGFNCSSSSYSGDLFVTGTHYWMAQLGNNNTINAVSPRGTKQSYAAISLGIRPIIQLKASVTTSGKNGNTWVLN